MSQLIIPNRGIDIIIPPLTPPSSVTHYDDILPKGPYPPCWQDTLDITVYSVMFTHWSLMTQMHHRIRLTLLQEMDCCLFGAKPYAWTITQLLHTGLTGTHCSEISTKCNKTFSETAHEYFCKILIIFRPWCVKPWHWLTFLNYVFKIQKILAEYANNLNIVLRYHNL